MKFDPGEINIICTDVQRSLYFYRDVLGMTVLGEEMGAVHLRFGDYLFLLLPHAKRSIEPSYLDKAAISFDVIADDLATACEYFQENNVPVIGNVNLDEGYFLIADPDGLIIEVVGKT